jgi:hypothetical protein
MVACFVSKLKSDIRGGIRMQQMRQLPMVQYSIEGEQKCTSLRRKLFFSLQSVTIKTILQK